MVQLALSSLSSRTVKWGSGAPLFTPQLLISRDHFHSSDTSAHAHTHTCSGLLPDMTALLPLFSRLLTATFLLSFPLLSLAGGNYSTLYPSPSPSISLCMGPTLSSLLFLFDLLKGYQASNVPPFYSFFNAFDITMSNVFTRSHYSILKFESAHFFLTYYFLWYRHIFLDGVGCYFICHFFLFGFLPWQFLCFGFILLFYGCHC